MSSRIIEPELGFSKPANRLKNVVLPDPLFPEIRFNTPESKLKSKSFSTFSFLYEKLSDSTIKFIFLYALVNVYIKLAYFPQKVFMYKYKIYNNIALEGRDYLIKENLTLDEENPEALLLRSKVLSEENFNEGLLCIGRAGAGVNNIPIDIASNRAIVVFNTPGANANAVKELVLCGLLLSSRGIIQGNSFAKSLSIDEPSKFNSIIEKEKKNFKGHELYGKTLGVVGLGAIGSMVAQSGGALGMKLMGYDPYISIDAAWSLPKEVQKANSLEELVGSSDFISIHVPLHESTKDLISKDLLKHFKRGSKLINLSRGGIVNNDDVIDALKNEVLSCFVTDFPSLELSRRSNESSDVILLPHIGASTAEAEINCAVMAAKQVVDFLKNGNIMNSVNFPRIKLSRSTDHRLVIINKNEPGMIGKIAEFIANEKLNISDMVNKSREDIAINLIDLDSKPSRELIQSLYKIEHVLSVRVC